MKLINLKSDLSKFNKEFKSRNTFDSDKNNILDDSYKGKALVGTPLEINKTIEYQLKTKLNEQKAAPNNRSWSVPNIADNPNFTPTSNYIDKTKLFYGGNIAPYSKGTPLEIITKDSKWKSFDYPKTVLTTPYLFDKPTGFIGNNDFSLPYENRYTTLTLGEYNRGTPLDVVNKDSKWTAFDYSDKKPFIFVKPTNFVGGNDFSLPFITYSESSRVGKYNRGTPLVSIGKDSKWGWSAGVTTDIAPGWFEYPLSVTAPYSFNPPYKFIGKNDFSLPFEKYTSYRPGEYNKGTPLVSIGKHSNWKTFDYTNVIPYSFLPPDGFIGNNDFSLPFTKKYGTITFSKYGKYNVIPLNIASSFDINKDLIIDTKGIPNAGFRLLLTKKYGSWNVSNPKGGFYTPTSNYIDNTKLFYNRTGVFDDSAYLLNGIPPVPIETKSTRNYPLNIGLDINKTYIQNLQQTYFGVSNLKSGDVNIASILAYTTNLTTSDLKYKTISDLQSTSVNRFGTLAQKWNTGGSLAKLNYISVGQENDRGTVEFGYSYYSRASDKSDPIGLYNKIPNKSISWAGPLTTKEQPFVFYLPPDSKGYPMVIGGQHGTPIAIGLKRRLVDLPQNNSRSASIIRDRNILGVRASDSILAINHFLQDTIRTTSVKPELPIKLFSGGIAAIASNFKGGFGSILGSILGTNSVEFDDIRNNPLDTDMITFAIVYFDKNLNYNKVIQFKSYLTQFNETISPEWSNGKFIGHPNNYYTYKGVTRSAQISFTIYSQNAHQREVNWKKINKLASMCYPQYSSAVDAQNRMQGPIIRLHLGSIYKGIPGFISNLTFTLNNNIPWDTVARELPHGIEVNMGYTIIGHVLPEMDENNHFDVYRNNRFDTGKGTYYKDTDLMDTTGLYEIMERVNRKTNDVVSIVEETIGNGLPF